MIWNLYSLLCGQAFAGRYPILTPPPKPTESQRQTYFDLLSKLG